MLRQMWTAIAVAVVGGLGYSGRGHPQDVNVDDPNLYYNDVTNVTTTTRQPNRRPASTETIYLSCEEARIKCALRSGCGMALQNYMLGCADLMSGNIDYCDEYCKNSLIALTSTEEGRLLMDCVCSDNYCRETKGRVEVCRDEVVVANADSSVVSCSVAHWICSADTQCSEAIRYYDRLCRKMFIGKECGFRCNNSISILQRQEKAAKLETCICDGTEDFDCVAIKNNMARLCFHQYDENELEKEEEETNEIDTSAMSMATHRNSASTILLGPSTLLWTTFFSALISTNVLCR